MALTTHAGESSVAYLNPNGTFAEYIKFWRDDIKKINQQELGKAASTSGAYICMIEKGAKLPSEKVCAKLADALGRPRREAIDRMRKDKERRLLKPEETPREEHPPADQYSEDINRFLDTYRRLSMEEKRALEVVLTGVAMFIECRRNLNT